MDSGFCRGEHLCLIKSAKDHLSISENAEQMVMNRKATAMRKGSEWGIRAFQGSFPRMKVRFIYEENGELRKVLLLIVFLFNLRTRMVGMNQIIYTYMPHMAVEANMF